jgi:hypothetical protein
MQPLPTRAPFVLPFGYTDENDERVHREGILRLPTQKDLIVVLKLGGEVDNPAYLEALLLSRIIVRLGDLPLSDANRQDVVEALCLPDVEYLNEVYLRLSRGVRPGEESVCPRCGHHWVSADGEGSSQDKTAPLTADEQ